MYKCIDRHPEKHVHHLDIKGGCIDKIFFSGTTWLSGILPFVLNEGDEDKVNAMGHRAFSVPYIELNLPGFPPASEILKTRPPPRVLKTHLRYEFLQKQVEEDKAKVIVIFRNPKDTIVSFYHFYRINKILGEFTGTFHEFFELVKARQLHYGDIFDWYKDWWPKKDLDNILTLKYEDLINDSAAEIGKIAKFCNKVLDGATIQKIADACSLKQMKVNPNTTVDIKGSPFNLEKGEFYRKGVIGDWKNHFNEEESKWVDSQCEEHLKPIGLDFDYE